MASNASNGFMKQFLLALTILTFALKLSANETNSPAPLKIGATEAANYYDQEMIVTGKVAQVTIRPKVVFINIDRPFPNSPFTLVIFPSETNKFGDLEALNGKNIEAKGKIKKYHEKPEIVLNSPKQLIVIESTKSSN
jgi:DNA/RNA endonuclease YhcR with UshA esterase domain